MSFLKNLFLFFPLFILITMEAGAQPNTKKYDAAWKQVEQHIEKGLPQSALEEVRKIYAWAKTEKADAQFLKAIWYIGSLQDQTREDNDLHVIAEIEKELSAAKEPITSLLENMLAGLYLNYYKENRWNLYNRTETTGFNKNDIATWSAGDFHKKISDLYLQSLQPEKLLQSVKLNALDPVIKKGNMRHLRPTLYDLLAHNALSYFDNDETDIKRPAYAFEINMAEAFAPATAFIKVKFTTTDSASLKHKALETWQKLIGFHLKDANPSALIDADLARLEFVKNNSTHPDKDNLYFHAVKQVAEKYGQIPAAAQAWYLLALWYEEKANTYEPYGDSTHRLARVKAKEILERIVQQKDSSEGKIRALQLLQTINTAQLNFQVEQVNIPNTPFRSLFTYRNLNRVFLRLVKVSDKMREDLQDRYGEKFWSTVLSAPVLKTWEQALPGSDDMQTHSAEIKIDGLPSGDYMLIGSETRDFSPGKTALGAGRFYVSGISYVHMDENYFVLDRDQGQPLAGAEVQVWEQYYDYKLSKQVKKAAKKYTTDKNGWFRMEYAEKERNSYSTAYSFDIRHKDDRLFIDRTEYVYYDYRNSNEEPKVQNKVFLFLDRAIYRPGQTLFFKGIVLRSDPKNKTNTVEAGYETTIVLANANRTEVDTIKLKANEFGSFSGKFQLPASGLNGYFRMFTREGNGETGFRVEEYKRPKFYVDFEPVKGTYRVGDTVRVDGYAKAYAGNNIDGAQVKYRVLRRARFPYPWYFKIGWFPRVQPMEIANGTVTTGNDGKFSVTFIAIPDRTVDPIIEPVFDYVVSVDVTDINGETRSTEKTISAGYKSLLIKSTIPETSESDSLRQLVIRTENMNGDFIPSLVKLVITRLQPEQRLVRNRYWERPDQFVMSKEEYINNFPYDEYDNETDYTTWKKGGVVLEQNDSTRDDGSWLLNGKSFTPGTYLVEISTTDKDGATVKDQRYIELYKQSASELPRPVYLWTGVNITTVEPGEKALINWGTTAKDIHVIHHTTRMNWRGKDKTAFDYTSINNEKKSYVIPVDEKDRGGFGTGWMFIKNNRVYQVNETISIPWTNKELDIEYMTFRDKTLPGSEEKWKVRITGYKKEMVAAEMLASMYDASLDQLVLNDWEAPSAWPTFSSGGITWDCSANFSNSQSSQHSVESRNSYILDKRYDRLFWNNTDDVAYETIRGGLSGKVSGLRLAVASPKSMEYANANIDADAVADEMDAEDVGNQQQSGQTEGAIIRKNFNETAFFFPDLHTDSTGAIEFSFTMPEALTQWKFMALAHTKDAAFGSSTKEIVTQKELMVQPNPPRFLREGDKMEFTSKIVNLGANELTGTVEFRLFDAETMEPVDGAFRSVVANQYFTVAAGQSEVVRFPMEVPYLFNRALLWRVVAKAGNYSDGEENILPVLTNRMLVTETLPLHMNGAGTQVFDFTKLLSSGNSETLKHHALTIEYASNPAWFAIQALPYLDNYPYECAEQTWNRYFANSLAAHIAGSSPKIRAIFEKWRITDTVALMSNLQKNQELKAVLLEETPWVLDAKTEAEQKRNIALLFDMVRMTDQLNKSYEKLREMQSPNGGFVWFKGGPDDRYITQYIVSGIGHLRKLGGILPGQEAKLNDILNKAMAYLDRKVQEDYDQLVKSKTDLKKYTPGYYTIQSLYARSFFNEEKIPAASQKAYDYFMERVRQTWTSQNKYMQGMSALALYRKGDSKTADAILKSLKETSILHAEMGRYWKDLSAGWFWHEAPIETQALLIEAFQEIARDTKTVDELRTWLLKNKQTNNWNTTKATAEACYALLLQGTDWLSAEPRVTIMLGEGNRSIIIPSSTTSTEAGTGYFKRSIAGEDVLPELGKIKVNVAAGNDGKAPAASWGGAYWQYFEDLDRITNAETPLKLVKKLFVEKNTDRGPVLSPINDGDAIKTGDKIKVRIELRVDRDMEYVHMKDMRASAFEPVNVLSGYRWQGGLGYYETTKDASTNFFFNSLRKGTYVFEYSLFATHSGEFSNGITTIQSMYAPEFSSHSEGVTVQIEN